MAASNPYKEALNKVYNELLNRNIDDVGLEYWTNQMAKGTTLDQIKKHILHSNEYKQKNPEPGTMEYYRKQAELQYDPTYNQRVAQLKNSLAKKIAALNQQIPSINYNYDKQIQNQNLQNQIAKNNFSNNMLSRGLGRSTIYTTGAAEMDLVNNRLLNEINERRTSDLNNIAQNIALLQNQLEDELTAMELDRLTAINELARKLEQQDYERQLQEWQKQYQLEKDKYEREFREWQKQYQIERDKIEDARADRQLAMQEKYYSNMASRSGYSGGSSSSRSSSSSKSSSGSSTQKNTVSSLSYYDKNNLYTLQQSVENVIKNYSNTSSRALEGSNYLITKRNELTRAYQNGYISKEVYDRAYKIVNDGVNYLSNLSKQMSGRYKNKSKATKPSVDTSVKYSLY